MTAFATCSQTYSMINRAENVEEGKATAMTLPWRTVGARNNTCRISVRPPGRQPKFRQLRSDPRAGK